MSKRQKSRTRPRVRVHMLQVSQNAVQLLHTPVAGGPSGMNESAYWAQTMQEVLLHRRRRKRLYSMNRFLRTSFPCLTSGLCLGVMCSYVQGLRNERDSQVAEAD